MNPCWATAPQKRPDPQHNPGLAVTLGRAERDRSALRGSAMMTFGWTKRALRLAFGGALGLAVVAAVAPSSVRAQDDEEEKTTFWNFDKKVMNQVMRGLGLRNGNENNQIEYRERSPLVIPPSRDLPQPQEASAGRTPAWPADPDVKRR